MGYSQESAVRIEVRTIWACARPTSLPACLDSIRLPSTLDPRGMTAGRLRKSRTSGFTVKITGPNALPATSLSSGKTRMTVPAGKLAGHGAAAATVQAAGESTTTVQIRRDFMLVAPLLAFAYKPLCRCETNPAVAAGNQCNPSFKLTHMFLLTRSVVSPFARAH